MWRIYMLHIPLPPLRCILLIWMSLKMADFNWFSGHRPVNGGQRRQRCINCKTNFINWNKPMVLSLLLTLNYIMWHMLKSEDCYLLSTFSYRRCSLCFVLSWFTNSVWHSWDCKLNSVHVNFVSLSCRPCPGKLQPIHKTLDFLYALYSPVFPLVFPLLPPR